jgi:hypothetical protein
LSSSFAQGFDLVVRASCRRDQQAVGKDFGRGAFRSLYHLSRTRAIDADEMPELILFWFKTPTPSAWPKPSANATRRKK